MKNRFWLFTALIAIVSTLAGCAGRGSQQDIQRHGYEQQGSTQNDPALHNPALQPPGSPDYLNYGSGKARK
ncbi:hypothetical protein [Paenibacillus alkalitolerans]|uniref:hypothetical protein n=1 Tax=Paenibacillus alkalitolerans TaxID=2799335 RepID=UPI0018F53A49|nr:hypothetical protein [Paenibacillus alkalitolerans]